MCVIPTYDIYIDVPKDLDYPTDTRTYGMVSGLWVSMYALGDFVGPTIGGYLYDEIGFVWLMTWVAGFCIVTTGLVVMTWFFEKRCCIKKSHHVNDHTDNVNNVHDVDEKTPLIHQDDTTNSMRSLPPGFLFNASTDVENSVSV
ncbi:hypothetical protein DPMN_088900 [Dreissena polymorpha]|uniref:Uncharacterized protein n=1 Tax=Dreissena polymorpha TaxID=45954 RepID=A0A9D4KWR2_DREPO|nr:hypothetical protein DPMN_088900 [Dreissena polymorpha]